MSIYDQINNIPRNSFQMVDTCNLPIYFDTTINQSGKYEFKSSKSPISILKTGDLQKPVIRFARLIGFSSPNSTIPEYANAMLPSSNLYTVYCDIDNKYSLYTTDESNNNYFSMDFQSQKDRRRKRPILPVFVISSGQIRYERRHNGNNNALS